MTFRSFATMKTNTLTETLSPAAHTAGPWAFSYTASADTYRIVSESLVIGCGGMVAQLIEHSDPLEGLANARLIAAAPDLLNACRRALEDFQSGHANLATYDALFAAIARATTGEKGGAGK